MILPGLLAFVALVLAIIALAQNGSLRSRIDHLERERRAAPTPPAAPPTPAPPIPPPLPSWLKEPTSPPATPVGSQPPPIVRPAPVPAPPINWESFVGVKLFAWIGGFAFFLGVVFFVKYAFENNLITPVMRIILSGAVGLAIIAVGALPKLRNYRIPAQSLIATGLLICYADIYCAHSFYNLIPLVIASLLMWLVTGVALGLGAKTD